MGRQDARRGGAAGAHGGDRDGDAGERGGVPARRPPGSLAAATGASLLSLAHDPYGTRRKADWTAALPAADVAALAAGQDAGRARNGFTGHETLDRTGFVHMGGRLHDPRLGRFPSPDPIVSEPFSGQGWNLYSYVGNSPTSRTDPTGYCYAAGPLCQLGRGGGFTSVTQAFTGWNVSWRIPVFATVTWGRVSFGVGGSFWNGEGGGFFGRGGFFRPRVSLRFGLPFPVFTSMAQTVSLGQETSPADAKMGRGVVIAVGEAVWDFVIGDTIDAAVDTGVAVSEGDWGGAVIGAATLGCDIGKLCKGIGKVVGLIPGTERVVDSGGKWVRGLFRSNTDVGDVAQGIGGGHAFRKHARDLGFETPEEMAEHVERVMRNPTATRSLQRGRTAYWDDATKSVVIHDPSHLDGGTVFLPNDGREYFDTMR